MTGRIEDGALVTVEPCGCREPRVGDAVLVEVSGKLRLHLIADVVYKIADSRGNVDGLAKRDQIYGVVTKVEP